jgi:hypothetical protein
VNKGSVKNTIHNLQWGKGDTYMNKAFMMMREGFSPTKGGRPGLVPQIGVLVTDGEATNMYTAKDEADALKREGVSIFAVGKIFNCGSSSSVFE